MRGADSPEVNLSDWEPPWEPAPDTGTFSPPPMDIDLDEHKPHTSTAPFVGPLLPGSYLLVVPHSHGTDSTPKIIPIDCPVAPNDIFESKNTSHEDYGRAPWFPFRMRADFEATKISVKGLLSTHLTDNLLRGASSTWNSNEWSRLTLQNHREMRDVLASAQKYGAQVKSGSISASYQDKTYDISFEYRDPWDWITRLLEDDTLGPHMIFNSVRKYYCEGTHEVTWCERVINEPNTADTWAKYESELPDADPYPHCLVPLHVWLDEGLVTKHIIIHPMLLRALCLPEDIQNASGNGAIPDPTVSVGSGRLDQKGHGEPFGDIGHN
ncbi:hypothetical protein C8R44DRAFT_747990 [Mycena epipterygia]|nr:hypothetical protein C8R44DRAFT_747990 [Mycena epipterygia]